MSRISADTLNLISSRLDAVELIGRYVSLKRQGRRAVGLCPFHGERTPSFSVDPEQGLWYCFGCSEGGSVFNFLMKIEGLSFPQAVRQMAEEVGVVLELEDENDPGEARRRVLLEILERTAQYYSELLLRSADGEEARHYLSQRGISPEVLTRFRLGWAPAGGRELLTKLTSAGYERADGVAAGLLREYETRTSDLLRGRIVFPITDVQGRILAFGGRILKESEGRSAPKYLNTPETEVYEKRRHLYGLSFHRGQISRAGEALVMEGYLDVIASSQAEVPLAVASLGTSLTEEQCHLLARYAKRVHLFYDADKAGRAATEKAIELFEGAGLFVQVALLEQGQDPDSLLRERGVDGFLEVKASTVGVVDYLLDRKSQEFDLQSRGGLEGYLDSVLPALAKIRDGVVRSRYVKRLATELNLSEVALEERLNRGGGSVAVGGRTARRTSGSARRASLAGASSSASFKAPVRSALHAEERLLAVLIREPQWMGLVEEHLSPNELTNEELRPCLEVLSRSRSNERPVAWSGLPAEELERQSVWARLVAAEIPESSQEEMERLIRDIKRNGLKPRLLELQQEVRAGIEAGTLDRDSPLYQEYLRLQQRVKGSSRS